MPDTPGNKSVIVGAGLAGLALAVRLAAQGRQVEVYEQNNYFGGKATQIKLGDFVFDAGPSLFTMPQYVDEVFAYAGKNPRDYYSYSQLDTLCHYFYEDGFRLIAPADSHKFAEEAASLTNDSKEDILRFLNHAEKIHELTEEVFLRKSLHRVESYLNKETLKGILGFHHLDAFQSMEKAIRSYLKDPHLIQLFCRYATYNGSNPYSAPGTLNVIPHLEFGLGAYMPKGGIHAIPSALYKLAEELGVQFHFNQKVDEIVVRENQARGIRVGEKQVAADSVITNADIWPSFRELMPKVKAPEKILAQERSSSAFIFYWAMDEEFPELDVHNIFFSADYPEEFEALFERKELGNDPTVYVHISSKVCSEHAPAGKENWFLMVNAPQHIGQDWEELKGKLRPKILAKLSKALGKEISKFILEEEVLTPEAIQNKTSSYGGSLYGTSSNNRFAAFLRHPNFTSSIKGLYFCGGSVHPGGGIPLVMSSAKIVSDLIAMD